MNSLAAQFGNFAIAAFIIYFILRAFGPNKEKGLVEGARQHALWCAIIGYFASSNSLWFSDAIAIPYDDQSGLSLAPSVTVAATPALWIAFIYVASQYTWPRKLKPQRTATLSPRSLTSPLPKKILVAMMLVLAAACVTVYSVHDVGAISPQPAVDYETADYSYSNPAQDGLRASAEVLPYLYLSFGFLMVSTIVASIVILRRKPLPGISEHNNRLLRTTWLNRLYRTVTVLLATQAGEAIHYKARWFHDESTKYIDGSGAGIDYMDSMSRIGSTLDWGANYATLAISALMLFWRPPINFENLRTTTVTPFVRARTQLLSLQYFTAVVTLVALFAAWWFLPVVDETEWPTGERATWKLVLFAGAAMLYLAVNALYLCYMNLVSRQVSNARRHSASLPLWSYIAAGLLFATSAYFLLDPPLDYLWGFVPPGKTVVAGLIVLLLATHLGFVWFSRRAIIPWAVSSAEEIWYRKVLELRSMRVITSAVVAMLLIGYGFPAGLGLFALLIFVVPAVIFLERPGSAFVREHQPAATS
ncbi:hypothetical protein [Glutamicibacter sp. Je.9.36]|uniref:hypothetical protein n=1 Tax=Glutamicibacter sp. Je.9.36 TaxID=3142837 RepID=UPI003DA91E73